MRGSAAIVAVIASAGFASTATADIVAQYQPDFHGYTYPNSGYTQVSNYGPMYVGFQDSYRSFMTFTIPSGMRVVSATLDLSGAANIGSVPLVFTGSSLAAGGRHSDGTQQYAYYDPGRYAAIGAGSALGTGDLLPES